MKATFIPLLFACLAPGLARAALLFYEPFNYTNGSIIAVGTNANGSTNWFRHAGNASPSDAIVKNHRLEVSATGGTVNRQDDVHRNFTSFTNTQTIVYAGFTVQCTNLPPALGTYFAHFYISSAVFHGRVFAQAGALTNTWRLGISGAANTVSKVLPVDLGPNTDYQVVVQWDPTGSNAATLWVNPISSADPNVVSSDGVSSPPAALGYAFRQGSGFGNAFFTVSNLAVATTFDEAVTNVWATNAVAPVILYQPQSRTNFEGESFVLTALAAGQGQASLTYQWRKDGANFSNPGGNTNVLSFASGATSDSGNYDLVVTTPFGSSATSSVAFLWVTNPPIPPSISQEPSNITVFLHQAITLQIAASGPPPLSYQWYLDDSPVASGGNFAGANSDTLAVTDVFTNNGTVGTYRCDVSNPYGTTSSSNATVTAMAPPGVSIAYLRTLVDPVTFNATNSNLRWQVTGTVTTFTNLTLGDTSSYYLQDATGGINIFVSHGHNFRPAQGDVVTFTGWLSSFNSNLELAADTNDLTTSFTIISNNFPLPSPITIPFSITNNLAFCETNLEGSLVTLTNVFFGASSGTTISTNVNTIVTVTNGNGETFMLLFSPLDLDTAGRTLPSHATAVTGPLTQTLGNGVNPRNQGYQVAVTRFSDIVNILSYTVSLPTDGNFILIANQLDHGSNTLNEVLPNVPDGTTLLKWDCSIQDWSAIEYTFSASAGRWSPNGTLVPGEGALIGGALGSGTPTNLTFTGTPHVPVLPASLPCGRGVKTLLSCQTSQVGTFENITGLSPIQGSQFLRWNVLSQDFVTSTFSGGAWSPSNPVVNIGEAAMLLIPACTTNTCLTLSCATNKTVDPASAWSFDAPSVSDACNGTNFALTILSTITNGASPQTVTRTWQATDLCSNSMTCSQVVTLQSPNSYTLNFPPGYTLFANQIDHGGNTLNELFPNPTGALDGDQIQKYNCNGTFTAFVAASTSATGWTDPVGNPVAAATLVPGEGAFYLNNHATTRTITFTGTPHVPVLPAPLPCPCGTFNLLSRATNDVGTFENITGVSPRPGAQLSRWNGAGYTTYTFSSTTWGPSVPSVNIGEAVLINQPCVVACTPPIVTNQPQSQTVCVTQPATFNVAVSGSSPLFYQWQKNGISIPTATNTSYSLTHAQFSDSGTYRVVVTNACGSVSSSNATLVVNACLPVFTCATNKTVNCGSSWSFDPPTAVSACCTNLTITVLSSVTNGSLCPQFITRTWQVADCCSNLATCSQMVAVMDIEPCLSSSRGTEFWLTFPGNYAPDTNSPPQPQLFITGATGTVGTVSMPGLAMPFTANFTIPSGPAAGEVTITLPAVADLGNANNLIQSNGIHVVASQSVSVFGYNHIPFTTDAFLGLSTHSIGKSYLVLSYGNVFTGVPELNGSQFAIVATVDNTTVSIIPSNSVGWAPFSFTMMQGQTYQLRNTNSAPADISGTSVVADQPIAVFGSHQCANIPNANVFFADYLVEQLFPLELWGTNFVTVPLATRANGDTFRFMAMLDGTTVSTNHVALPPLQHGQFNEVQLRSRTQITSTKPIQVAQYADSSDFDFVEKSDPFMVIIPPTSLFATNYVVQTPTVDFTNDNYINIMALTNTAATSGIFLDGSAVSPAAFSPISTSGYSGAQVQVTNGPHTLASADGSAFGVIVYGWAEYDAYGYPGGICGSAQTQTSQFTCPQTNPVVQAGCNGLAQVPDLTLQVGNRGAARLITQAPAAGTLVGLGTNNITLTIVDQVGATQICTTPLTVLPAAGSGVPVRLTITGNGKTVTISWPGCGLLQKAPNVAGPWTTLSEFPSPYTVPISAAPTFFRVVQ